MPRRIHRLISLRLIGHRVYQHVLAASRGEQCGRQEEAHRRQPDSPFHCARPFHLDLLASAPSLAFPQFLADH
jgi:hypothetical protein